MYRKALNSMLQTVLPLWKIKWKEKEKFWESCEEFSLPFFGLHWSLVFHIAILPRLVSHALLPNEVLSEINKTRFQFIIHIEGQITALPNFKFLGKTHWFNLRKRNFKMKHTKISVILFYWNWKNTVKSEEDQGKKRNT